MEDYLWMERWENEQAANDLSTRAINNAMMTRPYVQPGLYNSASQSNAYPINFEANPPITQPNAATNAGDLVNSTPSPPLSVPSAATSAPIPY